MADAPDKPFSGDDNATESQSDQTAQLRRTIADVYTFVRSREINKTIASFTLDHYIDEAKRKIQDTRVLRSASNPDQGVGTRPSQLDAIAQLQDDFNKAFSAASKIAQQNEAKGGSS